MLYLGCTLDAFDFFIPVFLFNDVAKAFDADKVTASFAVLLTLIVWPIGALIFGLAADRFGRRPTRRRLIHGWAGAAVRSHASDQPPRNVAARLWAKQARIVGCEAAGRPLDHLAGEEAEILAVAGRDELHAHRQSVHEPGRHGQTG